MDENSFGGIKNLMCGRSAGMADGVVLWLWRAFKM